MARLESVPTPPAEIPGHINVVVLRGVLSSPPRQRELPSGANLQLLEVSTRLDDGVASVPVVSLAAGGTSATLSAGDEVVVVGRVVRRFFRVGGATQSRTEVVADRVVNVKRRQAVERAVARAAAALTTRG